jgi:hypothetical protein
MMTNVIAALHTTFAYQSAVVHLMVGQANFEAQQLHLREALPITVPATNSWNVAMPPDGLGGALVTSNFVYRFENGKLVSIQMQGRLRGPEVTGPAQVDAQGAYQLARQWLAALPVDVNALEREYPHTIQSTTHAPTGRNEHERPGELGHRVREAGNQPGKSPNRPEPASRPEPTNGVPHHALAQPPIFRIVWGAHGPASAGHSPAQVVVEVLASTKQCVGLRITNPDLLTAPPLQVTNAAALLGPPPAPQHFVEELLGGPAAYTIVAQPDRVQAWLLGPPAGDSAALPARSGAATLDAAAAAMLSRALTDFDSYSWLQDNGGLPNYGVCFRFTKGADTVDICWAPDSNHVQIIHGSQMAEKDCNAARASLLRAIQPLFPNDNLIHNLAP